MSLTTAEAADELGVSMHEVRRLISTGDLVARAAGRVWLVDERSVRLRARTTVRRGRALAPATAWAALQEASGGRASWIDGATRARLRAWLRRHDSRTIAAACRLRAERSDFRMLPAYRDQLVANVGVAVGGISAAAAVRADLLVMSDDLTELYCDARTLNVLKRRYGLAAIGTPNLIVRVPRHDFRAAIGREGLPAAAVAVDLIESLDVRTGRAGRELLAELITQHVGAPARRKGSRVRGVVATP